MEQEPDRQIPQPAEAPKRPGNVPSTVGISGRTGRRTDAYPPDPPSREPASSALTRTTPHAVRQLGALTGPSELTLRAL